jgi:hypothetical protein
MKPIHLVIFDLQNMHFDSMGNFRWNVAQFQPMLEKHLTQAYEEGKRAGRDEMGQEVGKMLARRETKVV